MPRSHADHAKIILRFDLNDGERLGRGKMELLEHIDGYALYAKRAVTVPLIKFFSDNRPLSGIL